MTTPSPESAFLILTPDGLADIGARVHHAGAAFYLNPGVASGAEVARLRAAGAQVHVLPQALPFDLSGQFEQVLLAAGLPAGRLWIEHPAREPARDTAPAPLAALDTAEAEPALHERLATGAARLAGGALRRLRSAGGDRPLLVLPYLGFGNARKLWIRGRVLDEASFREQTGQDSSWSNLVALYHRLESDEVAGARVLAHFDGRTWESVTDGGGYFEFEITPASALAGGSHRIGLELPEWKGTDGAPIRASAEAFVPAAGARFGIISDIDDTVLWTNVTNKLNMALMLARTNAHTRKPFKGVAAFYRALRDGAAGNEDNPLFYVSSSPWHLFGFLVDFLKLQGIPVGPLLLRELGLRDVFKPTQHGNHKLDKIELILSFYPDMQFVLIGDSGEKDPEIYTEIVRRHPQQVRMIYIRNVNPDPARIDALDSLIEEVSTTGTQLVLAPDSVFAAAHAAAEGLIGVDRLAAVRSDKKEDDGILSAG
ncbi:App1 family protein [Massilia jejuensis]|uniref:App1 family protein n=1 Tax=Massilia jejuensis TaxID=648894 RepID=A0ABW0PBL3_9BURK